MNREIKFRVWAKQADDDGCIGFLETRSPVAAGIYFFYDAGWRGIGYFLDDDNFVVQQFTGLKDTNDKEIYEGDIIKYQYADKAVTTFIGCVEWFEWGWSFNRKVCGDNPRACIGIEVVGNIFENPELL
jgi:uncharacterized phage protein (TIGR01671 family)